MAYGLSKLGNRLQVRSASIAWGNKGARLISISPGMISTPMNDKESHAEKACQICTAAVL